MTPILTSADPIEDLAELLGRFGDIPPKRILYHPSPGTATEADVLAALEGPRKRICELIDGVLVEKPMEFSESLLATLLVSFLNAFVRPNNLGLVTGADGTVRLWAGRVRIPDVAFTSWDRMPGRRRPTEPIPQLAPNLAVEILSSSKTPAEMALKRQDYFTAGVEPVWEVDPSARTVQVWAAVDQSRLLTEADTLDGGSVLPGFTLPLRELFSELDRHG